ncbi:hypothetical protein IT418_03580 [bacterium]|nr:hypothetical protein [bacterium]
MYRLFLENFSKLSVVRQYFFARTFYDWGIYIFDAFYLTYVFKESGDVSTVVSNALVTLVAIFFGFILGSILMNKIGVERNLRFSFVLFILTGMLGVYLLSIGAMSFLVISLARGVAEGFFWAYANIIELSGLPFVSRGKFYSISQGVNGIFSIVAPVTLGYLLTKANSLIPSFIIFSCICIVAVLVPYKFDMNERLSIDFLKFERFIRRQTIGNYITIKMVLSAIWMIDWLILAMIPLVILGNELNIGVYLTVSSLVGVVIAFITRAATIKEKVKFGGPLVIISACANLLFAFQFTPIMLYVNSLVVTIASSITSPMELDLSVRITNSIDTNNSMGVELNLFQEFVYTVMRVIVGVSVISIFTVGLSVTAVLKLLVVVTAVLKLVNFFLSVRYLKLVN